MCTIVCLGARIVVSRVELFWLLLRESSSYHYWKITLLFIGLFFLVVYDVFDWNGFFVFANLVSLLGQGKLVERLDIPSRKRSNELCWNWFSATFWSTR